MQPYLSRWLAPAVAVAIVLAGRTGRSQPPADSSAPRHLTPAQQRVLAAPCAEPPDASFGFDRPAGPNFSEAQKQAQRQAAAGVLPRVQEAFGRGAESVRIPPGDYRFGRERWDREGVVFALEFSGLQRDPEHTFTIDARGVTFWFDLPDDQAPTAHFALGFRDCRNVVFRGATLDRGTRGHVEGRIANIDFAGNRVEIELSPGLTVPTAFSDKTEQRLIPFKADGTFCAPLYALQRGGTRLKYRGLSAGSQPGRWWVELREPALLKTLRDTDWQRAYGQQGLLGPGDGLSCVYAVSSAIELVRCRSVTIDGLRVFMPKGWGAEWGGDGGHLWKDCYFGPRPGTSQWQGGEGFMFCATRYGTTLDHVTIRHTTDDTANFHGYWSPVEAVAGASVTIAVSPEFRRCVLRDLAPGDRLLFHDRATGQMRGAAAVVAVEGTTMTLDRPAEDFANTLAEWPDHACAGWTVQNCQWQDNYQRLLIQSGPGTVRNCRFTRQGSAVQLNSVMPYVEGGVPREITIAGNVFSDVNPVPHGAAIEVYVRGFGHGAPQLENVVITGNTFAGPGEAAVALANVRGGRIADNRFQHPGQYTALARPQEPGHRQAVWLSACRGFQVEGNSLLDPGGYLTPDSTTGSPLLGCDERCAEIRLDGRPCP